MYQKSDDGYRRAVEQAAAALKDGLDGIWALARLTYENTWNAWKTIGDPDMSSCTAPEQWASDVTEAAGRQFPAGIRDLCWVWAVFYVHPKDRPILPDSVWGEAKAPQAQAPAQVDLSKVVEPIIERFDRLEGRLAGIEHTLREVNDDLEQIG